MPHWLAHWQRASGYVHDVPFAVHVDCFESVA
jgi:hypothetical protein